MKLVILMAFLMWVKPIINKPQKSPFFIGGINYSNMGGLLFWLVVYLPLWNIWVRQLGWFFPIYGGNIFQTTNQKIMTKSRLFPHAHPRESRLSAMFISIFASTNQYCFYPPPFKQTICRSPWRSARPGQNSPWGIVSFTTCEDIVTWYSLCLPPIYT